MDIIEEKPVAWVAVKKLLETKAKEKELGYEQKNALEHLKKFCQLGSKAAGELETSLAASGKLKEKHIVSILNFLPQTPDELRLLLSYDSVSLSEDERKGILQAVKTAVG